MIPSLLRLLLVLLVATLFVVWFGGLLFYSAVVVPLGTRVIGSTEQGMVTARVTLVLNLLGLANVMWIGAGMRWSFWLGDGSEEGFQPLLSISEQHSLRAQWLAWGALALVQLVLFLLHFLLNRRIDFTAMSVADPAVFYSLHRIYLFVTMLQMLVGLWWLCLFVSMFRPNQGEVL